MPEDGKLSLRSSLGVPELMVLGTLVSTILLKLWPGLAQSLALVKHPTFSLSGLFGLITYPFAGVSMAYWILSSLILLAAGWLMRGEVSQSRQALLLATGWGVGGIVFLLVADPMQAFHGPGAIARAFLGAGAAYAGLKWRDLHLLQKACGLGFATIILLDLLAGFTPTLPFILSAVVGCALMSMWFPVRGRRTAWANLGRGF